MCPYGECQIWRCLPVDQSEAIFICNLMQAVLAYRADVRFPRQLLRLRLSSPTLRHGLGRLRMPAPAGQLAVYKIDPWPPLLSHLLVHVCR
jgi:hypothetical protein